MVGGRRRRQPRREPPVDDLVERLEYLLREIGRKIPLLPLVLLHLPIGRPAGDRPALVLPHFLVVPEEVVPLVVALVLAPHTAAAPAIVLDPLPPELGRLVPLPIPSPHPPFVVHLLRCDQDHRLLQRPVPLPILPRPIRRRGRRCRRRVRGGSGRRRRRRRGGRTSTSRQSCLHRKYRRSGDRVAHSSLPLSLSLEEGS